MAIGLATAAIGAGASIFGASRQAKAAKSAASAQTKALRELEVIARGNEAGNASDIASYYPQARTEISSAYGDAIREFDPILASGDKARELHDTAIGLNGSEARNAFYDEYVANDPANVAARDLALRNQRAVYGSAGKGGSGAFYRSLLRGQMEIGGQQMARQISYLQPAAAAGTAAREARANTSVNRGNAFANLTVNELGARTGNRDNTTAAVSGATLQRGQVQAQAAVNQGNIWAQGIQGVGNAFATALGSKAFASPSAPAAPNPNSNTWQNSWATSVYPTT